VDELSAATGHQSRDPRPGTASSSVVEHPYVFNRPSVRTRPDSLAHRVVRLVPLRGMSGVYADEALTSFEDGEM